MKINVNGNIIDVKDIYKISPIFDSSPLLDEIAFEIKFFNNVPTLLIEMNTNISKIDSNGDEVLAFKVLTKNLEEEYFEIKQSKQYITAFNKLNAIRDSIIKIWSDNQTNIPTFLSE